MLRRARFRKVRWVRRVSPVTFALLLGLLALPISAGPDSGKALLGKETFRSFCASCHGSEAGGDGPVAEFLSVKPADLTRISERHDGQFPEERVFMIIDGREKVRGHGSSDMPVWGDAFQKADENLDEQGVRQKIETLVQYLESIQAP